MFDWSTGYSLHIVFLNPPKSPFPIYNTSTFSHIPYLPSATHLIAIFNPDSRLSIMTSSHCNPIPWPKPLCHPSDPITSLPHPSSHWAQSFNTLHPGITPSHWNARSFIQLWFVQFPYYCRYLLSLITYLMTQAMHS